MANPSTEPTLDTLPFKGEWSYAKEKKYKEAILLVPFYGAKKISMRRHKELLNRLGYDCVLFELKQFPIALNASLLSAHGEFGLKHVWADQIERILSEISGPKIVFAFSNPSASAIEAIARRKAVDISGLICDGGPAGNFWKSFVHYFKFEEPLRTFPLRALAATWTSLLWDPQFFDALNEDMMSLPQGFRVLSIRGWKDKLISPQMIDQVFEPHHHLDWQKLSLPKAEHLNGLKDFAEDYEPAVEHFLRDISNPL